MVNINRLFQKLRSRAPDQPGSMREDFLEELTPKPSLDYRV